MSTDKKLPLIYRFTNATVLYWRGDRPSGTVSVISESPLATSSIISKETQDKLRGYSTGYVFFEASEGDLIVQESTWSRELISYVPADEGNKQLRSLTEEEFEQLTPGFKNLYRKELSEPIETKTDIEFELQTLNLELKESILLGQEFLTDLHRDVNEFRERAAAKSRSYWNSNSKSGPIASFDRNLPLIISSDELIQLVDRFGRKILSGSGFSATVSIYEPYQSESVLRLSFFAQPYDGSVKKVLDQKRGGGAYADGRGRMVRDLPAVVGKAHITKTELGVWWEWISGNDLPDEEKQEAIQALTNTLWKV